MSALAAAVAAVQRQLAAVYALDLDLDVASLLMCDREARRLVGQGGPRTGVLVLDGGAEAEELLLGLYFHPEDRSDPEAVVEETSHCLCLAWHACERRPVSQLVLELQGEIDRWVVARLSGRDPFAHFLRFRWLPGLDAVRRGRYERAHRLAHRYCRGLARRFPGRADTPGLLRELRRFYRAPCEAKLRAAG